MADVKIPPSTISLLIFLYVKCTVHTNVIKFKLEGWFHNFYLKIMQ